MPRFEIVIVEWSEELGKKILNEAFPELLPHQVEIMLILWPRGPNGSLKPLDEKGCAELVSAVLADQNLN